MAHSTAKLKKTAVIPDVRAEDPEHAMERFTKGLRRVLSARKSVRRKPEPRKRRSSQA